MYAACNLFAVVLLFVDGIFGSGHIHREATFFYYNIGKIILPISTNKIEFEISHTFYCYPIAYARWLIRKKTYKLQNTDHVLFALL